MTGNRWNRGLPTAILTLLTLAVLLGSAGQARAEDRDNRTVHWLSYREALEKAERDGKPVLLHFTAAHSGICRRMKRETYRDMGVIRYLNEHFAVAMVESEQLPALARKYKVDTLPVLWFLDRNGKALTSVRGEVGVDKMRRLTEYIAERVYEHTAYDTWLDKRPR